MRQWIGLAIWVAAILFPLALVGRISKETKEFLDWLLEPEWLHVVMHLLIYGGLAFLLAGALRRSGRPLSPLALAGVIVLVCTAQELLQNLSSVEWGGVRGAILGSAFDLGVDLIGGLLGLLIFNRLDVRRKREDRLPSH
jgi:hypothetical protein